MPLFRPLPTRTAEPGSSSPVSSTSGIRSTTIFGEYRHDDPGANLTAANVLVSQGADLNFWAGGVVQDVEAAAMDLYAICRHSDGDFTNSVGTKVSLDNFDMVIVGALIQF